ncbi:hypothetical protein ACPUYX_00555 [Desulfosporosinus sp. SYSU MS00001]|uniref:hypothetical protein n=1 Tax=Desulfosporosinus sp. SYSU MS00001 TaxID=3416284 RepID=UPI003CF50435
MRRIKGLSKVLVLMTVMVLFLSTIFTPKAFAASAPELKDGQPISTVMNSNVTVFSITVPDLNKRFISVDSDYPVRTELVTANSFYSNMIHFDSGAYRMNSRIARYLIPNTEYLLYVYSKQTSGAKITINMSTSGLDSNWIYKDGTNSLVEKNELLSGQTEFYGLANQTAGRYLITVTTNIPNLRMIDESTTRVINNSFSEFKSLNATWSDQPGTGGIYGPSQTTYGIWFQNPSTNPAGQGGTYSITITKA